MTGSRRGRLSAWLTLAAMSFQLVLGWGHIHLSAHQRAHPAGTSAAVTGELAAGPDQEGRFPADGDPEASCMVCWTMRLAACGLVAGPLTVPHPAEADPLVAAALVRGFPSALEVAPFDARAPPVPDLT